MKNTLTNVNGETKKDPYKDLTSEANKFTTGSVEVKQIESIKQEDEEKDDNGDTTEYSTNTFMFNKKDFIDMISFWVLLGILVLYNI